MYYLNKTEFYFYSIPIIQFHIELNASPVALNHYSSLDFRASVVLKLLEICLSIFIYNEAAKKLTECLEMRAVL